MFGYDDLLGGMADFNVENKVTPKSIPHTEDFKMPPQANADCKNMDITYITADIRPEKRSDESVSCILIYRSSD